MGDVVPESGVRRPPLLAVGTVVWLASEVMFFAGLFAAYFTLRAAAEGPWPPEDVELDPVVTGAFTALLVVSSGTMQLAVRAIGGGRRSPFRRWVLATAALAVVFLANQAREWAEATFGPHSHSYGSAFYVMTGFHGLHVAGGVLAMAVLLGRATDVRFGRSALPSVELVSYYWHFVDVVWLAMFAVLFVVP